MKITKTLVKKGGKKSLKKSLKMRKSKKSNKKSLKTRKMKGGELTLENVKQGDCVKIGFTGITKYKVIEIYDGAATMLVEDSNGNKVNDKISKFVKCALAGGKKSLNTKKARKTRKMGYSSTA